MISGYLSTIPDANNALIELIFGRLSLICLTMLFSQLMFKIIAFFLFGIINTDSGCGIFTYVKQSGCLKAARVIDDVCYFRHAHMQGIVNFINYYYVVYDV